VRKSAVNFHELEHFGIERRRLFLLCGRNWRFSRLLFFGAAACEMAQGRPTKRRRDVIGLVTNDQLN